MGWAAAPDARAKAKHLATGADLDAFVGLAGRRAAWLSTGEHKLVSDSREAATRQQRRELWRFRGVVAAAVVAIVAAAGAWQQRNNAIAEAQRAEENAKEAERQTGRVLGAEAQRRLAQPITQETSPLIAALATAGWRMGKASDAWDAMQRVPLVATLARIPHDGPVYAVAFSPDGKSLATASGGIVVGAKGEARIVAVADGRELARITHDGEVWAVAFSPDGKSLPPRAGTRRRVYGAPPSTTCSTSSAPATAAIYRLASGADTSATCPGSQHARAGRRQRIDPPFSRDCP